VKPLNTPNCYGDEDPWAEANRFFSKVNSSLYVFYFSVGYITDAAWKSMRDKQQRTFFLALMIKKSFALILFEKTSLAVSITSLCKLLSIVSPDNFIAFVETKVFLVKVQYVKIEKIVFAI
jgi:hypothetical protein